MAAANTPAQPEGATGVLVLADGTVVWGKGFGHVGEAVGEVCFNTAMTGYQEVMTDPSYAAQIVTFTFPHIGNVGANSEDVESRVEGAVGCVVREEVTPHSSFRAEQQFGEWLAAKGRIGLSGVDTRALTRRIRLGGAPNAVIAHDPQGRFDIPELLKRAREWPGLEGMDLAPRVSREKQEEWGGGVWTLGKGYARAPWSKKPSPLQGRGLGEGGAGDRATTSDSPHSPTLSPGSEAGPPAQREREMPHVVAIDYGSKDNIFRNLAKAGARVTVVPAKTTLAEIEALSPDGVFLSNGPGDPAATGAYAVPVIQALLERDMPVFGICLGHQLLGLAAGARTTKMHQGHRGANHPVKRLADGVVEITSMNHGFAVDNTVLPEGVEETHVSLFDGSNCGIALKGKRAFGVQYHPEASPGPQDSFYLFEKFVGMLAPQPRAQVIAAGAKVIALPRKKSVESQAKKLGRIANETLSNLRGTIRKQRKWLIDSAPVPRELAEGLVRASAWWHTHSSGSPVRAPRHANRMTGDELTWQVEFGANSFLAARAIRLARPLLTQAYDELDADGKPDVSKLKRGLRLAMQRSVANVNGDLYDLYPVERDDMMFGAQSIDVKDAADFLIKESGLAPFLKEN